MQETPKLGFDDFQWRTSRMYWKKLGLTETKVMIIKFFQRYSNVVEHGIKDGGKRAYQPIV